jgi:diguanylate cyclase (GGDEF)-like protein
MPDDIALLGLTQALVLYAGLLLMLRLRTFFGLGPLFLTMGALEGLKYFLAEAPVAETQFYQGVVLASAVYYPASMAMILQLYRCEGIHAARKLVWSLVLATLLVCAITAVPVLPTGDGAYLRIMRLLIGSGLLLLGSICVIAMAAWLGRLRMPFFLASWLALSVVAVGDTVAYETLVAAISSGQQVNLLGSVVAKCVYLGLFTAMGSAYLWACERVGSPVQREVLGDVASAMTYQERFQALEQALIRDSSTGLFNRRYFDSWLPDCLREHAVRGSTCALLMLDLDHFKRINDSHGHAAGDRVLVFFSQLLESEKRRSDLAFRVGGEEFCIVQPGADRSEAEALAERLLDRLRTSPVIEVDGIVLGCTIGIAISPADGRSARTLLEKADRRLYAGKQAGRGRLVSCGEQDLPRRSSATPRS